MVESENSVNVDLPKITVNVGSTPVVCLLDTGAACSILSQKVFQKLPTVSLESCNQSLTGVSGAKLVVKGKSLVSLQVNGRTLQHSFFVVVFQQKLDYDGIIGMDFLRKFDMKLEMSPLNLVIQNVNTSAPRQLKLAQPTCLRSATCASFRGPGLGDASQSFLIEAADLPAGIISTPCIVNGDRQSCVGLANMSSQDILLPTSTVIAFIQEDFEELKPSARSVTRQSLVTRTVSAVIPARRRG